MCEWSCSEMQNNKLKLPRMSIEDVTVGVLVLGDLGRSPRMLNHARALHREGYKVNLIGYRDTDIPDDVESQVTVINIPQVPKMINDLPRLLKFVSKTIWLTVVLMYHLLNNKLDILLVQNPPAVPTLAVSAAYCYVKNCKLVIDWHNYTYTILRLPLRPDSPIVLFTAWIEKTFGRMASGNICVSNAMKEDLKRNWKINAATLYDRPLVIQRPGSETERQNLLNKISKNGFLQNYQSKKVGLLVSSTSWTADEDFSVLLNALTEYDTCDNSELPPLICVVTGKGELKTYYEKVISRKQWTKVHILTPWLEVKDYPRLLACADLGVCMHTSSSGLDLPMKIVDMFGSGLPVCAYRYECLKELVEEGVTGFTFANVEELSEKIKCWFRGYPEVTNLSKSMFQNSINEFRNVDWYTGWHNIMPSILDTEI